MCGLWGQLWDRLSEYLNPDAHQALSLIQRCQPSYVFYVKSIGSCCYGDVQIHLKASKFDLNAFKSHFLRQRMLKVEMNECKGAFSLPEG